MSLFRLWLKKWTTVNSENIISVIYCMIKHFILHGFTYQWRFTVNFNTKQRKNNVHILHITPKTRYRKKLPNNPSEEEHEQQSWFKSSSSMRNLHRPLRKWKVESMNANMLFLCKYCVYFIICFFITLRPKKDSEDSFVALLMLTNKKKQTKELEIKR